MEGAKPLPRPPQRAKSPNDTQKIRKGRPDIPVGCRAEGKLSRGAPQDAVLQKTHKQNPRQREETYKRFDSLARVFALDGLEVCHAAISAKLRPRGHPRAACGPPFSIFGLRPRRNGVGFRFLRKARKGLCPFHPYQPFFKRLDPKLDLPTLRKIFHSYLQFAAALLIRPWKTGLPRCPEGHGRVRFRSLPGSWGSRSIRPSSAYQRSRRQSSHAPSGTGQPGAAGPYGR